MDQLGVVRAAVDERKNRLELRYLASDGVEDVVHGRVAAEEELEVPRVPRVSVGGLEQVYIFKQSCVEIYGGIEDGADSGRLRRGKREHVGVKAIHVANYLSPKRDSAEPDPLAEDLLAAHERVAVERKSDENEHDFDDDQREGLDIE